ncbi:hypothetical protein AZSI13_08800 [Azospira sp. I13]|uniref:hypothetical protein n=1 Tax=Azospira sp. I13 TaxID=1765050 RepID=UPI000D4E6EF3|nr:hypothetical protein [Azospira sp. I13]GBG01553.1 hypothetical protein AZSI13_08800 [Azospira sp. I13]
MTDASSGRPPCNRCRFYYITHDPSFPYGCRALDFKSQRLPGQEVQSASGQICLYFKPKPNPQD